MKKQSLLIMVLTVALVISVVTNAVLFGCWQSARTDDGKTDTPRIESQKEMIDITTPYGVLQYPAEYSDKLSHKGNQENEVYTHTFSMLRGEETVELFSVHFGDEERGTEIGWLTVNDSPISITVTSTSIDEDAWSNADVEQFGEMQMAINDVIASMQDWKTFTE